MIGFLAEKAADFLVTKNIIEQDEKSVYKYGAEITLSTLLGFALILTVGAFSNNIIESVMFLLCCVSIRIYSGGYHADTYLQCNLTFISIFAAILLVKAIIPHNIVIYAAAAMSVLSFAIIFILSPVENKKKPLTSGEKVKYKKKSIILSVMWTLAALVLYIMNMQTYSAIPITMFTIAILMVVEKIIKI